VVGSSVGVNAPTTLYVPSVPVYAFNPSLDIVEEASSTLHSPPWPTGSPRRTRQAKSPKPLMRSKHATVEVWGPSYDKPIVESSTKITQDCLGRLVSALSTKLASAPSWKQFIMDHCGESYLTPDLDSIDHSAQDYLQWLREQGVCMPLDDPPWSTDTINACALCRPHPSANLFKEFLHMRWQTSLRPASGWCYPLSKCEHWTRTYGCHCWWSRMKVRSAGHECLLTTLGLGSMNTL
jgi:hypothetical protein